jgi:hypothetical protein
MVHLYQIWMRNIRQRRKTYVDSAIVNGVLDASATEKLEKEQVGDIGGTAGLTNSSRITIKEPSIVLEAARKRTKYHRTTLSR